MDDKIDLKLKISVSDDGQLNLKISTTDVEQFQPMLNILTRMITDDRVDVKIRMEYLSELIGNIVGD